MAVGKEIEPGEVVLLDPSIEPRPAQRPRRVTVTARPFEAILGSRTGSGRRWRMDVLPEPRWEAATRRRCGPTSRARVDSSATAAASSVAAGPQQRSQTGCRGSTRASAVAATSRVRGPRSARHARMPMACEGLVDTGSTRQLRPPALLARMAQTHFHERSGPSRGWHLDRTCSQRAEASRGSCAPRPATGRCGADESARRRRVGASPAAGAKRPMADVEIPAGSDRSAESPETGAERPDATTSQRLMLAPGRLPCRHAGGRRSAIMWRLEIGRGSVPRRL